MTMHRTTSLRPDTVMRRWHRRMGAAAVAGLLALISGMSVARADAPDQEVRRYLEKRGDRTHQVLWCLEHGDGYRLTSRGSEGVHTTRTDDRFDTLSWRVEDPSNGTVVQAVRRNDAISVQGTFRGRAVDKQIAVDADPWFQASSFSLRGLVVSERESIQFWTLRSDTLKPYKLNAVKKGVETITVRGEAERAVRVELRLAGWMGPFWKSDYWYRPEDGLLLRFQGTGDAVGSCKIVITYTGSAERCDPSEVIPFEAIRLDLGMGKR